MSNQTKHSPEPPIIGGYPDGANQATEGGGANPNAENWQVPDTYVTDPEEAHTMAIAGNRNESNLVAFKKVAEAQMLQPDVSVVPQILMHSPRDKYNSDARTLPNHPENPAKRSVSLGDSYSSNSVAPSYTADQAIEEAQKERAEADRVEKIASDRYRALKDLDSPTSAIH
ncbi:MAG: hypothetical protein ACM3JF_03335 [Sphaerimonospora mesophila]